MGQYPDGLWGPFIIHDPNDPYEGRYDDEIVITLTDWYHEQMPNLLQQYESRSNAESNSGDEPTPDAALINASTNTTIPVEPNKTYLVRVICVGNFPGHAFLFDQHEIVVVEVDGIWIEEVPVGEKNVRIATGQRMSVLLTTKEDASQNYAMWNTMDINMLFFDEGKLPPPTYNPNVTAHLVYNDQAPLPPPPDVHEFNFIDDVSYIPYDREPVLEPVDHQILMDMNSATIDGVQRFTINNITYLPQKVPTLYTALTVGDDFSSNPEVYGQVNPFVVNYGEVVEIIVNDHHENLHPFHLHGHQFQVLERTAPDVGYFPGYGNFSQTPMRRDTIMVQQRGYTVIRFRADNPDKSHPPLGRYYH
jgi:iron transport multicopper oxidase